MAGRHNRNSQDPPRSRGSVPRVERQALEANQSPPSLQPQSSYSGLLRTPDTSSSTPSASLTPPQPHPPLPFQPLAKVAIPRIRKPSEDSMSIGSPRTSEKHRVSHACEPCRHRKTKCSGERPVCKHCQDFDIICIYGDGKRDRVKREYGEMVAKTAEYESLLQDLSIRVGKKDQESIEKALQYDTIADREDEIYPSYSTKRHKPGDGLVKKDSLGAQETEDNAGTIGSNESLDRIDEDFNRTETSRATGYLGKNSEVRWIQRLKENSTYESTGVDARRAAAEAKSPSSAEIDATESWGNRASRGDVYLSDATYHLDDMTVLIPDQVEPYELPPQRTADILFNCYLDHVQFGFPLIGKTIFAAQYHKYFNSVNAAERTDPGRKWLAVLNLIFAIGAKFSHLIQAEWRGDERDHLIYFTRARILAMNGDTIIEHPDLQQVQVTGLLALYFLSTNQINRAYNISGIALRYSITLGLNLRNEDKRQSETSRETRSRIWWAVYTVERLLGVMTGRPSGISELDCTTPLPVPLDEDLFPQSDRIYEQAGKPELYPTIIDPRSPEVALPSQAVAPRHSSQGESSRPSISGMERSPRLQRAPAASNAHYLISHVQLSMLTQEVLDRLYCPATGTMSWSMVQNNMTEMELKLEKWQSGLPLAFDFLREQTDQEFTLQRQCLGFAYHSAKIIITRPCLCRIERHMPQQSDKSNEYNRAAAQACTEAAIKIMELLPEKVDPVILYSFGPWWCVLHYIVQAATVLMLELSFRSDHMPEQAGELLQFAKKSVQWLAVMSEESIAARRAWNMSRALLEKVAGIVGGSMRDVPRAAPPQPSELRSSRKAKVSVMPVTSPMVTGIPADSLHLRHESQEFQHEFSDQPYCGGLQTGAGASTTFFSPMYTAYDGFLPDLPTNEAMDASPNVRVLFPSAFEMDHSEISDLALPDPFGVDWNLQSDMPPGNQQPPGPRS